jgi:small subunit ribosomal protein S2
MPNQTEKTSTIAAPSLLDLLKAGVHFGHLKSKWHPKMAPFIFSSRSGVHIINLEVTRQQLESAMHFISDIVSRGGTILIVGTKKQVSEIIKTKAEEVGMPYVHQRWIGGLLTNYGVIGKMIQRHQELGQKISSGKLDNLTKKDRLSLTREFARLEEVVGGISKLSKIPEAVFLIDLKREKTALAEARKMKVPVIALCDTNVNPQKVDYPIASNDDAVGALKLMLEILGEAVKEGQARRPAVTAAPQIQS